MSRAETLRAEVRVRLVALLSLRNRCEQGLPYRLTGHRWIDGDRPQFTRRHAALRRPRPHRRRWESDVGGVCFGRAVPTVACGPPIQVTQRHPRKEMEEAEEETARVTLPGRQTLRGPAPL